MRFMTGAKKRKKQKTNAQKKVEDKMNVKEWRKRK